MSEQEGTKKRRIRAGHRSSAARLISQVQSMSKSSSGSEELNIPTLSRMIQTLKDKLKTVSQLDEDILKFTEEGDDRLEVSRTFHS